MVISHDSLEYQKEELLRRGYLQDEAKDYDNVMHVSEKDYVIHLPKGYYQVYGDGLEDNRKAKACHYGFQKEEDDGILTGDFREGA